MEYKIEHFDGFLRVSCNPNGVCPQYLSVDVDRSLVVKDMGYVGGCDGNLGAIRKLIVSQDAEKVVDLLKGNTCGNKTTSCADVISQLLDKAVWIIRAGKLAFKEMGKYEES